MSFMNDIELGIKHDGLSQGKVNELKKSVASLIEMNKLDAQRQTSAASNSIQRRGQNLSGDIGNNFGNGNGAGYFGPYCGMDSRYPNQLGIGGGPLQFGGYGSSYTWMHGIQGSNALISRTTRLAHYKMSMCVSAYKGFGVAKNVIDLMANFASEGLTIKHGNKTVQKFYKKWAKHVDLQGRVKDMLRYYYKYGNVFVYTTNGVIDKKAYDKMRRSRAKARGIPGFAPAGTTDPNYVSRKKKAEDDSEREIPWRYTLLNPFQMEIRGSKIFGRSRWVFVLDEDTSRSLSDKLVNNSYIDFLDKTDVNLPPEFADLSKRLSANAPDGEGNDPRIVELDQDRLWTMHYNKDDHEDWADPMLWPVMADVYYKNKLRQMDISVCESVINSITVFRLGNMKEGYIVDDEGMRQFAEFLRSPTQAMTMVWNDAIDVVQSHPPVDKILNMSKYESVDRDILRGIGIPDTLLGGASSSNFSSGFLGVRTLLERLEEGRNTVLRWVEQQLELIATTMGHRQVPNIRFGKMSLRDEKAEKQLVLGLLDRGVVSIQSVLECFGEDFEIEVERMREEDKIREVEGLLVQHGPYTEPMSLMTDEEVMDKEIQQQEKMARMKTNLQRQGKPRDVKMNGRPSNSEGIPQDNKRETKPKGMAWIQRYELCKSRAFNQITRIEKIVSNGILKAKGKKTKRSLTKEETRGVEEITFAVASHIGSVTGPALNLAMIQGVLKSIERVDDSVFVNYQKLKVDNMTLKDRQLAMASAIAMRDME